MDQIILHQYAKLTFIDAQPEIFARQNLRFQRCATASELTFVEGHYALSLEKSEAKKLLTKRRIWNVKRKETKDVNHAGTMYAMGLNQIWTPTAIKWVKLEKCGVLILSGGASLI